MISSTILLLSILSIILVYSSTYCVDKDDLNWKFLNDTCLLFEQEDCKSLILCDLHSNCECDSDIIENDIINELCFSYPIKECPNLKGKDGKGCFQNKLNDSCVNITCSNGSFINCVFNGTNGINGTNGLNGTGCNQTKLNISCIDISCANGNETICLPTSSCNVTNAQVYTRVLSNNFINNSNFTFSCFNDTDKVISINKYSSTNSKCNQILCTKAGSTAKCYSTLEPNITSLIGKCPTCSIESECGNVSCILQCQEDHHMNVTNCVAPNGTCNIICHGSCNIEKTPSCPESCSIICNQTDNAYCLCDFTDNECQIELECMPLNGSFSVINECTGCTQSSCTNNTCSNGSISLNITKESNYQINTETNFINNSFFIYNCSNTTDIVLSVNAYSQTNIKCKDVFCSKNGSFAECYYTKESNITSLIGDCGTCITSQTQCDVGIPCNLICANNTLSCQSNNNACLQNCICPDCGTFLCSNIPTCPQSCSIICNGTNNAYCLCDFIHDNFCEIQLSCAPKQVVTNVSLIQNQCIGCQCNNNCSFNATSAQIYNLTSNISINSTGIIYNVSSNNISCINSFISGTLNTIFCNVSCMNNDYIMDVSVTAPPSLNPINPIGCFTLKNQYTYCSRLNNALYNCTLISQPLGLCNLTIERSCVPNNGTFISSITSSNCVGCSCTNSCKVNRTQAYQKNCTFTKDGPLTLLSALGTKANTYICSCANENDLITNAVYVDTLSTTDTFGCTYSNNTGYCYSNSKPSALQPFNMTITCSPNNGSYITDISNCNTCQCNNSGVQCQFNSSKIYTKSNNTQEYSDGTKNFTYYCSNFNDLANNLQVSLDSITKQACKTVSCTINGDNTGYCVQTLNQVTSTDSHCNIVLQCVPNGGTFLSSSTPNCTNLVGKDGNSCTSYTNKNQNGTTLGFNCTDGKNSNITIPSFVQDTKCTNVSNLTLLNTTCINNPSNKDRYILSCPSGYIPKLDINYYACKGNGNVCNDSTIDNCTWENYDILQLLCVFRKDGTILCEVHTDNVIALVINVICQKLSNIVTC